MASILLVNPAPLYGARIMAKRRKHHSHRRHRYHHNPISVSGLKGMAMPTIKGGAIGAAGGLVADLLFGYTQPYLPTALSGSAAVIAATKLLYAIAAGMVGGMVLKGKGQALAVGAATVAIHDFAKAQLIATVPSLPLSGVGVYMSHAPTVGVRLNGLGNSQGRSVVRQLTRSSANGGIGAYLSRTGVKMPQRGMGKYMSGMGDTTFANGIPTG